jgi:phasin family protein
MPEAAFSWRGLGIIRPLTRPKGTIMTTEDMQKFGKDSMASALTSFGAWTKSAQAIAVEVVDYSKKSVEGSSAAWEKLIGAKSLEKAMEVQSEYAKSAYQDFIAEATKLSELYADLAKEVYKPFDGVVAKATL